jgi:hypothetical protein
MANDRRHDQHRDDQRIERCDPDVQWDQSGALSAPWWRD